MIKNNIKELGQYFTPSMVADFMCRLITNDEKSTVLEPCAGEGAFLKSLSLKNFSNIVAYEIDSKLKNETNIPIIHSDFLNEEINDKYDVIIGNPPYVRWKNIPKNIREDLKKSPQWKNKINGLSDLLYPFLYKCVELLENNGELIFITPTFWIKTQHSQTLRNHLLKHGDLDCLLFFNEMKIFKNVSSDILIFKFIKRKTNSPIKIINSTVKNKINKEYLERLRSTYEKLDNDSYINNDIFEAYCIPQFKPYNSWDIIPPKISDKLKKIELACSKNSPIIDSGDLYQKNYFLNNLLTNNDLNASNIPKKECDTIKFLNNTYYLQKNNNGNIFERFIKLGDIAEIGNGMVSGLDKAFKYDNEDINALNDEGFIPVIKASNLSQYFHNNYTNYIFVNDIKSENDLQKYFKDIHNHLIPFKEQLNKRYNYNRDIPWWHWVFLRNFNLQKENNEKIFVPSKDRFDKRKYFRFVYVKGNYYATQDVSVIVKKSCFKEDLKYILALLNSEYIYEWIKYKGLNRGGVSEFSERPLSSIPIRLINWDDDEEVILHDKIVDNINKILRNKDADKYKKEIESLISNLLD